MAMSTTTAQTPAPTTTMSPPSTCPPNTIAANVTALDTLNIPITVNVANLTGPTGLIGICLNALLISDGQLANLTAAGQLLNNTLNLGPIGSF